MDKKDWEDIVKEPVSDELRHRTMVRALQELDALSEKQGGLFSLKWLVPLVPGLALLVFLFNRQGPLGPDDSSQDFLADGELLDELSELAPEDLESLDDEMLADLEFYEDLEVLEDWDGQEEV